MKMYEPKCRIPTIKEYEGIVRRLKELSIRRPVIEHVFPLTVCITGCRISECLLLSTTDIDENNLVVYMPTLKHRSIHKRTIPIPGWYIAILHQYIIMNGIGDKLFNISRTQGWRYVKRITGYNPHAFRHALGMYMLFKGYDPETVRRILGHGSWRLVSYYVSRVGIDISKRTPLEYI